jgi:hypothetical protein
MRAQWPISCTAARLITTGGGRLAVVTGVAEAVGLGFASYGAHEAGSNTQSTSDKRFEDTIGRKQS